jgi:hypothetical protein
MGVAKFDDGIPQQDKFIDAGPVACWLWFCSVCHCRKGLTDGFISIKSVRTLFAAIPTPRKHVERLVAVGLWNQVAGGYEVNDYHDWNPAKAEVLELRRRDRDRKRIPTGFQTDSKRIPDDGGSHTRAGGKSESRSRSGLDLGSSEESARETDDPVSAIAPVFSQRRSGATSRGGGLVGNHGRCAPCTADACARGICVPGFLAQGWLQQFEDRDEGERHISAFVASVLVRLPDGPIGDDPLKFWRSEWAVEHGSTARSAEPVKSGRGARTMAAAREVIAKQLDKQRGLTDGAERGRESSRDGGTGDDGGQTASLGPRR